jgi:hypothetical protein
MIVVAQPGRCHAQSGAARAAGLQQEERIGAVPALPDQLPARNLITPLLVLPPGTPTHMVLLPLPLSNGREISFQAWPGLVGSEACAIPVMPAPRPAASPPAASRAAIRRVLIRCPSWMSVQLHPLSPTALQPR